MNDEGEKIQSLGPLICAIDQGTSSSRALIFTAQTAQLVTFHQIAINKIEPEIGWVEQDPNEILHSVIECIDKCVENLQKLFIKTSDVVAVGIANQRETTILWNGKTGEALHNAIVWLDTRTESMAEAYNNGLSDRPSYQVDRVRTLCGLPISSYFSALKIRWLLDNSQSVKDACEEGDLLFGTVDSWLIWNLTRNEESKETPIHITDVTNASRTMLMNLKTLEWDPFLLNFFHIPLTILPQIVSCSEIYGTISVSKLTGIPISGCLGDQQAALLANNCMNPGQGKATFGTGAFMLFNVGRKVVRSKHGLLSTVAFKLGADERVSYALEGSIAIAGAAVQWLKEQMGVIDDIKQVEILAKKVSNSGDVYFVPAFSGLFAPYWQSDARGVICGLSHGTNSSHLCLAVLESVCFQTADILDAVKHDLSTFLGHGDLSEGSGVEYDNVVDRLVVDGGMISHNDLLVQLLADLTGLDTIRPTMSETTALGAAIAAGSARGIDVWELPKEECKIMKDDSKNGVVVDIFNPSISEDTRLIRHERWRDAVQRSFHWKNSHLEKCKDNVIMCQERRAKLASIPPAIFCFTSLLLYKLVSIYNTI